MTLTVSAPRASESNHWYTLDGAPMYTVIGSNGRERPTTLRDARKLNLVPSVTTVLNLVAKPALVAWMQRQVLLSALTLPKRPDESEDDYLSRIMDDSKEQGRAAADAGTEIHASVQSFFEGEAYRPEHDPHVEATRKSLVEHFGHQTWIAERSFSHELGFGGKCDLHCEAAIVDIKTKEFTDPEKVVAYDDHVMQLAAYRVGLGYPNARCANIFVSRSIPGLVKMIEWSEEDIQRGWRMFCLLLELWKEKTRFGHEKD